MFDEKLKKDIIGLEMEISHFKSQLARVFAYEIHRLSKEIKEIESTDESREVQLFKIIPLSSMKLSLVRIHEDIDKISLCQTECSKETFGVYPRFKEGITEYLRGNAQS